MLILSKKFIVLLTFCMASIGLSSPAKFRPGCGQTRSHLLVTYGNFPTNVEKYLICALFWNCIELSGSERLAHIFSIFIEFKTILFLIILWPYRYSRNLPVCDPGKIWGVVNIVNSVIQRRFCSRWGKSETKRVFVLSLHFDNAIS